MSLNLLYLSPINRKTVSIELNDKQNIEDLYKNISQKESIFENEFKLYSNGKLLESTENLVNDSVIVVHFGLNGGKGGFGSMLRAIGAQIEKTTNREACRDLTGRRLRDINEEKRIKEWIKKEKSRKDEMEERRKEKLSKLAQKPKTEFNDLDFERTRNEIPDIVDEALQYGLQLQQKGEQPSTSGQQKRKSEEQKSASTKTKKKKVSLWIGDDIHIEDDSDDNEETIDDNTEDQTKDSFVSNDNTNDSEVTNGSKIIDNSSSLEKQQKPNETIVERNDSTQQIESICTEVTEEVPQSVPIEEQQKETPNRELLENSSDELKEQVFEPLNLIEFQNVEQLESLGLDALKHSLMALGLKCGGSLNERANRLWSIRGLDIKDIPKKLFAKKK